jgi:hypothetical protein
MVNAGGQGDQSLFQNLDSVNGIVGRGKVTMAAGIGTPTFEVKVYDTGDMLFNAQTMAFQNGLILDTKGLINLGGGTMSLNGGAGTCTINGGTLTGGGTVTENLTNNYGLVELSSSITTLAVSGNYVQAAGGTLETDASSDSTWGQLQVGGSVTLNGTLEIQLLDGYTPAQGFQKNTIGATGGVSGTFSTVPTGWNVLYQGANFVSVQKQ